MGSLWVIQYLDCSWCSADTKSELGLRALKKVLMMRCITCWTLDYTVIINSMWCPENVWSRANWHDTKIWACFVCPNCRIPSFLFRPHWTEHRYCIIIHYSKRRSQVKAKSKNRHTSKGSEKNCTFKNTGVLEQWVGKRVKIRSKHVLIRLEVYILMCICMMYIGGNISTMYRYNSGLHWKCCTVLFQVYWRVNPSRRRYFIQ